MRTHLEPDEALGLLHSQWKSACLREATVYHTNPLEPRGGYTVYPEIQLLLRSTVLFGHLPSITTDSTLDTTPQEKVVECQIWWLQRPIDGTSPSCPLPITGHLTSETTKFDAHGLFLWNCFRSTLDVFSGQTANLDDFKQLIIAAAVTITPEIDYNRLSSRNLSCHQRKATGRLHLGCMHPVVYHN
jgi:hypothetical protein